LVLRDPAPAEAKPVALLKNGKTVWRSGCYQEVAVEFSPFQRVVLAELLEIKSLLTPGDAFSSDVATQVEALRSGYPSHYGFSWVYEELSKDDSKYVHDLFEMYYLIQLAFGDGHSSDPDPDVLPHEALFPGFDGNHQSSLHGYALFLRENGQWDHVVASGNDINNHGFSPDYRAMLSLYRDTLDTRPVDRNNLTQSEAEAILQAGSPGKLGIEDPVDPVPA
jgi:uncharacterized protein YfbU (UPF0304 family)